MGPFLDKQFFLPDSKGRKLHGNLESFGNIVFLVWTDVKRKFPTPVYIYIFLTSPPYAYKKI